MSRPKVWIPRRLSEATLERARAHYDLVEEPIDEPAPPARIIEMSALVDAMIPCHSERFTAEVAAALDRASRSSPTIALVSITATCRRFERVGST